MNFLFLILSITCQLDGWNLLSSVEIVSGYDEFMGGEIDKPIFSYELLAREGKEMSLEGFIIPIEQGSEQDYFVLSRYPYQSCFFCGAAGPETVVEVYAKGEFRFTDDRVRVTGMMRLNKDNPLHLFYILENCKVQKLE